MTLTLSLYFSYMHLDSNNLSVSLVEEGFAAGWMADKSTYGRQIQASEDNAKRRKEKRWANYVEQEVTQTNEDEEKKDEGERKVNYESVVVTEVTPEGRVFAQTVSEGPKLEALMKEIRAEFQTNPPLAGAY